MCPVIHTLGCESTQKQMTDQAEIHSVLTQKKHKSFISSNQNLTDEREMKACGSLCKKTT